MSGHSKWHSIKHKKAAIDSKRGRAFTKYIKETAELERGQHDEVTYEGYGPSGVALILEVVTDNRNRTVSEIRHVFSKNGGNMGEAGSVSWMFHKKGYIVIDKSKGDEETLM